MKPLITLSLPGRQDCYLAALLCVISLPFSKAKAQPMTVPNGNMESPAVGAWSTTLPSSWTWAAGGGSGNVGLTSTGGANGSRQTLYGNQITGTLTSAVLSQAVPGQGTLLLRYWVKRANTGSFAITSTLLLNGGTAVSRSDVIASPSWTQYTVSYHTAASDVGKTLQIQFVFSNGSGAWQGYLDEVEMTYIPAIVSFNGTGCVQPESVPTGSVSVILSRPVTNTVTVDYFIAGGTATPGTNFNCSPGTLTFAPGVVSNCFLFSVVDDATYEGAKTVVFGLSNVVNAALGGTSYTVTIVDPEDRPSCSVGFAASAALQQETMPAGTISVLLSNPSTNTVSVDYFLAGGTATPGADFNFSPGTLTFTPGVVSNGFGFSVTDNSTYQSFKTMEFRLGNPVNTVLEGITNCTVTIVDPEDRPAPISYYVDSAGGNDSNAGTNANAAWKTLAKVNANTFKSGDNIFLKAGSAWSGQLHPLGSGDYNGQITVDMYGSGPKPVINAGGIAGGALYLLNQQYWSVNNLELSNYGSTNIAKKQGILIKNDCVGTLSGIYVRNCFIHDVNGVMEGYVDGKVSGGIVFYVTCSDTNVPSKWNDVRIENNTISNVVREGILLQSLWVNKPQDPNTYWAGLGPYYPSTHIRIASNILQRIGGDGIIPWAVNGAVVEYNLVRQANFNTPGQGHAGIWPYICENIIFQYNEVCETKTKYDGMAFDFDNSNQNCIYQYNYSHDNEGGFLNMCSGGNANGNIARYNLSQNDGCLAGSRVFTIYGPGNHNYSVYNNTIYVSRNNPVVFQDDGGGSSGSTIAFYNNIVINDGTGALYAPAGCVFDYNLFFGHGYVASDLHRLTLNPQLVGAGSASNGLPSVAGYKLMTNSPALRAGLFMPNNGGFDYWGNAVSATAKPNIGAYNGTGVPEIPAVAAHITWLTSGTNLLLSWPASHLGSRLLVQTNNLSLGVSRNTNDWASVAGSTTTNLIFIQLDQALPAKFYRLSY